MQQVAVRGCRVKRWVEAGKRCLEVNRGDRENGEKEGSEGFGGMWERRRKGSAQEGFQLRSLHSDLIWPVCLGYTQRFHTPPTPSDLLQSPLLSTIYLQQAKNPCNAMIHLLCPQTHGRIEIHVNLHVHANTDTEQKSWTGKINILVLTLHLLLSVFPIEEETETHKANVKTGSLKVQR